MRLSRSDIEQIGIRVNRAYVNLPSLRGQDILCVDPVRLASELCGLTVDYYHLSRDDSILGMTSYGPADVEVSDNERGVFFYHLNGKSILIESHLAEQEEQRGRLHFTIMHETAHQIMKMLYPTEYSYTRYRIHYSLACRHMKGAGDWEEWQADNLASVLLLPAELVKRTAIELGLDAGIKILNRIFYPEEYGRFATMAERLGASKQALAIRMKQLGLLGCEYLKDPYALVDIVKEDDEE